MRTSQVVVYDFLAQRSLAIVGVSRSGKKFGNTIYKKRLRATPATAAWVCCRRKSVGW
jgi:hypothetical protein